jgi:hypothetical protein
LENQTPHTIVVMQRVGRLGNQIGLLANLIAFSLATGVRISHPTLGHYANYFSGTAADLLCRYPTKQSGKVCSKTLRAVHYALCRTLDKSGLLKFFARRRLFESDYKALVDMSEKSFISKVTGGRFTFLTKGWFYRFPSVNKNHFLNEIQSFFDLVEPYKSNVQSLVQKARCNCDVLVGVHIRQTDFREHEGGKFYFKTDEYSRIMRHCQNLFHPRKVGFLVVSDETHSLSDFPNLECSLGSGIDIEDMYCLGGCDYIIGSIASSYSLWPAVLFQKPTCRISDCYKLPEIPDFRVLLDPWRED